MADASDLERWEAESRGTPPWVFIIFVVLTAFSAGACYFFYANLLAAKRTTQSLNGFVQSHIMDPLRAEGVNIRGKGAPGKGFFQDAARLLRDGVTHEKFAEYVGWHDKKDIEEHALKHKDITGATSLKDLYTKLQGMLQNLEAKAGQVRSNVAKAEKEVERVRKNMENIRQDLVKQINGKVNELEAIKKRHTKKVDTLRVNADDLEEARKTVAAEIDGLRVQLKEAKEDRLAEADKHQAEIAKRQEEIAKLKELETRSPDGDGQIAEVNGRLGYAMINIGEKDTVEVGERFEVYEKTHSGQERLKGEVIVRSVDNNLSKVGIVSTKDPLNPILKGDILRRKVLRRKYEIEERMKRRKAARE